MGEKVWIFDTTLRDGEQSPGFSMNIEEKIRMATQLAKLNVDVIEAGFPIASEGDFEAVKAVAQAVKGPVIAGLARVPKIDIDRAWEAVRHAERPRIHVFVATSDIHLEYKLRKSREEILQQSIEAVRYAKSLCDDIEYSPEDASRSDVAFLIKLIEAVIEAGATTVNIPDTVGYATPQEYGQLIRTLRDKVPNIGRARISVHCHNDLGLAVANSLAGVENGARQVECTINGIGERAGNAALEEVVMALRTRKDYYQHYTDIVTEEIYKTSRLLSHITGIKVQPNKAIVGDNAFAHEAGIHQDGVLKKAITYEIMTPQSIGLPRNRLVLGKHSGRHAFSKRLQELGYELTREEINKAFVRFKNLADKKKEIYDEDLQAIVEEELSTIPETFELDYLQTTTGNHTLPTATVRLRKGELLVQDAAIGDGPVDATYQAIDRITGIPGKLLEYSIRAVTEGKDAIGEVVVKVQFNGEVITGRGTSTDVIEASAKAYLNAVNKVAYRQGRYREAKS
ncbi:MAG: 2-isopropylmalate synthase [Nitrospinota bacterium]|nr:MAG: 2-isopropylmalate synthase [Nitrospinota bacterium]